VQKYSIWHSGCWLKKVPEFIIDRLIEFGDTASTSALQQINTETTMTSTYLKTASTLSFVATVALAGSAFAGNDMSVGTTPMKSPDPEGMNLAVALNSDSFFGFYPSFAGAYGLSEDLDLTVYGIYWGGGGVGQAFDDWTEFGLGVNYSLTDSISINPQIGFLSGNLLSTAGTTGDQGDVGEGVVPSITVNLNSGKLEGQFYAGLYLPIQGDSDQLEFLHTWLSLGYKVNDIFSAGGHVEWLSGGESFDTDTNFIWVGPYVQFRNEDKGVFIRFAGGFEFDASGAADSGTFWKTAVGFSF
jgi:hypothetical protein